MRAPLRAASGILAPAGLLPGNGCRVEEAGDGSHEEIADTYACFPPEALPEILRVASEFLDAHDVAA